MKNLYLFCLICFTIFIHNSNSLIAQNEIEPNNNYGTATPINLNEATLGAIDLPDDKDFYSFELSGPGVVSAILNNIPNNRTYRVVILDEIEDSQDSDLGEAPDRASTELQVCSAGTYYILVESDSRFDSSPDQYQLTVTFNQEDVYECNNSFNTAHLIEFDQSVSGTIYDENDKDYFRVEAPNSGIIIATLKDIPENITYRVEIYNSDQTVLERASGEKFGPGSAEAIGKACSGGIYFIKVESSFHLDFNTDLYELTVSFNDDDAYECNDGEGQAIEINPCTEIKGNIVPANDQDYFLVRFPEAGNYSLFLRNVPPEMDLNLSVKREFGGDEAFKSVPRGTSTQLDFSISSPGNYYISIWSASPFNYSFTVYSITFSNDIPCIPIPEICNNDQDDDGNGSTDCQDPACLDFISCEDFIFDCSTVAIDITETILPETCAENDGSISLSIEGGALPYKYNWSNGDTTEVVNNLPRGNYSVTVTDANDCTTTENYLVPEDCIDPCTTTNISISESISPETCIKNDGSISIVVSGGTLPYNYIWSNGNNSKDVNLLVSGEYTVTVIDEDSCTFTQSFFVPMDCEQSDNCQMQDSLGLVCLPDMIEITGGNFDMGCTREQEPCDADSNDEVPVRQVILGNYSLSKTEITQQQFQAVMGFNPSHFKDCGLDCPVDSVDFNEVITYCNRISILEGLTPCYYFDQSYSIVFDSITRFAPTSVSVFWLKSANGYRLPTEAEWEYGARGGAFSQGFIYSGSDNPDAVAWHRGISNEMTHRVASLQPNELGLFDMSGNIWEYCWDFYEAAYYSKNEVCVPLGPETGAFRSRRGGSWVNENSISRIANRYDNDPGGPENAVGFRVARGAVDLDNCLLACDRNKDSLALVAIYNALGGPQWNINSVYSYFYNYNNRITHNPFNKAIPNQGRPWLSGEPINKWHGVTLNNEGCVDTLILSRLGLNGIFPPEIGDLTGLVFLDMSVYSNPDSTHINEVLTGGIPNEIGNLVNLENLYLQYNRNLKGTIPSSLGSLTKLKQLYLRQCGLEGSLPDSMKHLTELNFLSLEYNMRLNGKIENIVEGFNKLIKLNINLTGISDTTIDWILNMPKIESFEFGSTLIQAQIPENIGTLDSLRSFNGTDALLYGPIPSSFGNLKNLLYLSVRGRSSAISQKLSGPIPKEIGKLYQTVKYLYLHNNDLEGCIPRELCPFLDSLSRKTNTYEPGYSLTGNPKLSFGGDLVSACNAWENINSIQIDTLVTYCINDPIPTLSASLSEFETFRWYANLESDTPIFEGDNFTPLLAGTYYVEAVSDTLNCLTSDRMTIKLEPVILPKLDTFYFNCDANNSSYTLTLEVSEEGEISTDIGELVDLGNLNFEIRNIPNGDSVEILLTSPLKSECSQSLKIEAPVCNCDDLMSPTPVGETILSYCIGDSIPSLDVEPQIRTQVNWYNVNGILLDSNTDSFVPGQPGIYFAEAVSVENECVSSTRTQFRLIENHLPQISDFETVLSDSLNYHVTFTVTDYAIITASPGILAAQRDDVITVVNIPISQPLTLRVTNSTGCEITKVFDIPNFECTQLPPPLITPTKFADCIGDQHSVINAEVPEGMTVNWYTEPFGGELIRSNQSEFQPERSGRYYAETYDPNTGCRSNSRTFVLTTHRLDGPIIQEISKYCSLDETTYTVEIEILNTEDIFFSHGSLEFSDNLFKITNIPKTEKLSLEAFNVSTGCSFQFEAQPPSCFCDNIPPPTPLDTIVFFCELSDIPTIGVSTVEGTTANWYDAPSGGNLLGNRTNTFKPLISGTYYAEAVGPNNQCISKKRVAITVVYEPSYVDVDSTQTTTTCNIFEIGRNIDRFRNINGCDSVIISSVIMDKPPNILFDTIISCNFEEIGLDTVTSEEGECTSVIFRTTILGHPFDSAYAGEDIFLCDPFETTIPLKANLPDQTIGHWEADEGIILDNPSLSNAIVEKINPGKNMLVWTLSAEHCPNFSRDTLYIYLAQQPVLTDTTIHLDAGEQININLFHHQTIPDLFLAQPIGEGLLNDIYFLPSIDNWDGNIEFTAPFERGSPNFSYWVCDTTCMTMKCDTAKVTLNVGCTFDDTIELEGKYGFNPVAKEIFNPYQELKKLQDICDGTIKNARLIINNNTRIIYEEEYNADQTNSAYPFLLKGWDGSAGRDNNGDTKYLASNTFWWQLFLEIENGDMSFKKKYRGTLVLVHKN